MALLVLALCGVAGAGCGASSPAGSTAVGGTGTRPSTGAGATSCPSVAIPAYFHPAAPGNPWSTADAAQPGIGIMVANVSNGPGTSADPSYATAIARARAAGATVFGYVYSSHAASSLARMEAQISTWNRLYGVSDIFIDQASTTAVRETYYQTLTSYVHAQTRGAQTILNFGTTPPQSDVNAGDILVTFEGDYSTYGSTTFPSWVGSYGANRFYNIVYDVPTRAAMTQVLHEAQRHKVGHIYATNGTLPNPYDTVPPYLASEAATANGTC